MCIRDSIEGVMAPDGEEQDAYILGVNEPVCKFTGKITVSYTHLDVYKRQSEYQNDFPFELKVYYQPEEDIEKKENDPELIQFVFDKKMVKYRCVVKAVSYTHLDVYKRQT